MLTYSATQILFEILARRPDPFKDVSEEELAWFASAEKKRAAQQARRARIWQWIRAPHPHQRAATGSRAETS